MLFKGLCKFCSDAVEGGGSIEEDFFAANAFNVERIVQGGFAYLPRYQVFGGFWVLGFFSLDIEGKHHLPSLTRTIRIAAENRCYGSGNGVLE